MERCLQHFQLSEIVCMRDLNARAHTNTNAARINLYFQPLKIWAFDMDACANVFDWFLFVFLSIRRSTLQNNGKNWKKISTQLYWQQNAKQSAKVLDTSSSFFQLLQTASYHISIY